VRMHSDYTSFSSCACMQEVPRVLLAVTACESLDLSGSFDQPGSLSVSSLAVLFNLTALERCTNSCHSRHW
jgi:hypothetical protein